MADERFAAAAQALAGVMTRAFGWRPDDFWSATPADLRNALGLDLADESPGDTTLLTRLLEAFPDDK